MTILTEALRGNLTEAECRDQGVHQRLTRHEVPHSHRPSAEDLLAEAARIRSWKRDPDEAHYVCRHGMDLGHPYGADLMCGTCESYGQAEEAAELEAEAGRMHGRWARANLPDLLDRRGGQPNIGDVATYGPDWTRGYIDGAREERS